MADHKVTHPENGGNVPAPTLEQETWLARELASLKRPKGYVTIGDRVLSIRPIASQGRPVPKGRLGTVMDIDSDGDLEIAWDGWRTVDKMLHVETSEGSWPEDEQERALAALEAIYAAMHAPQQQRYTNRTLATSPKSVRVV